MSSSEYARRMNNVLNHIDRNLEMPLDLPELAGVAHFSPFHFHRIFAAWMGETLGDYVRRRRLEVGALRLRHHKKKTVLDVALSVGFASGEAFARAFKIHFGHTPSSWRAGGADQWASQLCELALEYRNLSQASGNPGQEMATDVANNRFSQPTETEIEMDVKLVNLPATRIAYMRHIGPYGESIHQFWKKTFLPWTAAQDLATQPCYGIAHDDPSITPADKCRYDAAVEIPENFVPEGHAMAMTLPGGRYAVAQFEGQVMTIGSAWSDLCRGWLAESGMTFDDRPSFEYYGAESKFDPETGILKCEICIPVRPL